MRLLVGHVLDGLRKLPDDGVTCVVTSPPYWSQRAYGCPPVVFGGDHACPHAWEDLAYALQPHGDDGWNGQLGGGKATQASTRTGTIRSQRCSRCGAWLGELGSEPTPGEYVTHLAEVFAEVRRVLHPAGTLWLNLGSTYAGSGKGYAREQGERRLRVPYHGKLGRRADEFLPPSFNVVGYKPKDMIPLAWLVGLELQRRGWWLRGDIVWHRENQMPNSQKDRPVTAHELVLLLTKSRQYFYDYQGSMQPALTQEKRALRSVWSIPTRPGPVKHCAPFPEELVERCLQAGTPGSICATCGQPWRRRQEAWVPDCRCDAAGHSPLVLDPFAGSATVLLVAARMGCDGIGIELNPDYAEAAWRRLAAAGEAPAALEYL